METIAFIVVLALLFQLAAAVYVAGIISRFVLRAATACYLQCRWAFRRFRSPTREASRRTHRPARGDSDNRLSAATGPNFRFR